MINGLKNPESQHPRQNYKCNILNINRAKNPINISCEGKAFYDPGSQRYQRK